MVPPRAIFDLIYDLVILVPAGNVATYGQISRYVAGSTPRIVGFAMAGVKPGLGVPWQRVINARGEISPHGGAGGSGLQREILEAEGIAFDARGRIDLKRFGWAGPDDDWLKRHDIDVEHLMGKDR